eukprot:8660418-Alexandrium_andersonii.AAC.1
MEHRPSVTGGRAIVLHRGVGASLPMLPPQVVLLAAWILAVSAIMFVASRYQARASHGEGRAG